MLYHPDPHEWPQGQGHVLRKNLCGSFLRQSMIQASNAVLWQLLSDIHSMRVFAHVIIWSGPYSVWAQCFVYTNTHVHNQSLWALDTLGKFLPFLTRETTLVNSGLLSCAQKPFRERVYFKRKEFAPIGSKFFPCKVDPFQMEARLTFTELSSLKV